MKTMKRLLPILIFLFTLTATAVYADDYQDGLDAFNRGDYETALEFFEPFAEEGIDRAQYNLGLMYHNGLGVTQDYKEALKWYRLAAGQQV